MKRFTETEKWRDPWFRALTPKHKALWLWLLDNCDCAGVVLEVDWPLVAFQIGDEVTEADLAGFTGRIEKVGKGWWLPKFIGYQYGDQLNPNEPTMMQRGIMKSLKRVGIPIETAFKCHSNPVGTGSKTRKDKDKGKGKNKGNLPPPQRERNLVLDALAVVGGGKPEEVPDQTWPGVAKALSVIKSVSPEVTAEEIQRRAANYRTHFRGAALTPGALAKHWAQCAAPNAQQFITDEEAAASKLEERFKIF